MCLCGITFSESVICGTLCHNKHREPTKEEVDDLLGGVEKLTKSLFLIMAIKKMLHIFRLATYSTGSRCLIASRW
jgi:hypothetical protein